MKKNHNSPVFEITAKKCNNSIKIMLYQHKNQHKFFFANNREGDGIVNLCS
jgi:hypothetical protein